MAEIWEQAADKIRCPKHTSINTYVGSFAEVPMRRRCILDAKDGGLCAFMSGRHRLERKGT